MRLNPKYLVPKQARDVVRKRLTHDLYDRVYPGIYRKAAKGPIDTRKVVFVESTSLELSHSMERVYDAMQERGFTCEFISLALTCGSYSEYTRRSKEMCAMVATARLVFICETCMPLACLSLREGTKVVQLWHGCGAFKKFGMSTAEKLFGSSREEKMRYPEHRNTSLVTVSSPEVCWAYIEAMCMEKTPDVVQALGVSRTDAFFDGDQLSFWQDEAAKAVPATRTKRVLLYAPTFRGTTTNATGPDFLDIEKLRSRLGDEWILLVKHHPHVKKRPPIPASCADWAFDVSQALSIEASMAVADVCLTDYSSLVFEWSLFDRPIAFLAPDKSDYDDWRGFYYDYEEMCPGPVFEDTEEVVSWVASLPEGFDAARMAAFRQKFMASCDGHSTERIIAAALGEDPDVATAEHPAETSHSLQSQYDMTVVVPVYNAERYLMRCISSLDAQTADQSSFEVILVNDGSTDGSRTMCESVAGSRSNYVLVNQENQGVSVARNVGIGMARGRYIMFLDPDDTLSAPSIKSLVQTFDRLGEAVDLLTYPLTFHDVQTGYEHRHRRYTWLTTTGVYDLQEYPFVVQTTINVCVRNQGKSTPLFDTGRRHYEDQVFNMNVLRGKHALGFCADANYTYYRELNSTTMARDGMEQSFDDVLSAFESFLRIADESKEMARYVYALILYNVSRRMLEHKFYPDFGDEETRAYNYERLWEVLRAIPLPYWKENPYLSSMQLVALLRDAGQLGEPVDIVYDAQHTEVTFDDGTHLTLDVPSCIITICVREKSHTRVEGFLYSPTLVDQNADVSLEVFDGQDARIVPARYVQTDLEDGGIPVGYAWFFDVKLPPMSGKPYTVRLQATAGGMPIPALDVRFEVRRSNGRRIMVRTREFGDRRMSVDGNMLHVGTIKDLPAWTMPAVTRLVRWREASRTGNYDVDAVRTLRKKLPKAMRVLRTNRVWLYVQAPDVCERDLARADGVVRLQMEDLEGSVSRVAAFLGAERVVSTVTDIESLLPCDYSTWDRVADFSALQVFEYVGNDAADFDVTGTFYDVARG